MERDAGTILDGFGQSRLGCDELAIVRRVRKVRRPKSGVRRVLRGIRLGPRAVERGRDAAEASDLVRQSQGFVSSAPDGGRHAMRYLGRVGPRVFSLWSERAF